VCMLTLLFATLLTAAAPAGRSIVKIHHGDTTYEFIDVEASGEQARHVEVCVSFVPTGTRVRQNTCSVSTTIAPMSALQGPDLRRLWTDDALIGYRIQQEQLRRKAQVVLRDDLTQDQQVAKLREIVRLLFREA
jgi:hypothetical protein